MTLAVPLTAAAAEPVVHRIRVSDLATALRRGLDDFRAIPTQLVFLGLLYPVIGFIAARAAVGDLRPLLFPILTGISLMGPVMAVGLYEISRRREAGLPVTWLNAFDVLKSPAIGGIIGLGLVLLVVFAAWVMIARGLYATIMPPAADDSISSFLRLILQTPAGHRLIVIGNLVGACFAVFVLTVSVVSFPMLLDRNCTPPAAVRTSIRAVIANPAVLATWGLIVAALLIVGSLPVLVGLAVVMPVLGHATWHLYRLLIS